MSVNDVLFDEGGAVYNVRSTAVGLLGDGVTDDSTAFYGNITSGGHYVFPAGTYFINASGSLPDDAVLEFENGAVIRPGAGCAIGINGVILAGNQQVFDSSLGSISFAGNRRVSRFFPEWWGMVGDGVIDDRPALADMLDAVPDGSVIVFMGSPDIRLAATWVIYDREGLTFTTERDARQGSTPVPRFLWGGASAGERLIQLDRCRHCTVDGFYFDCTAVDVAIDMTGSSSAPIGTQCTITRNTFRNQGHRVGFVGIRIAPAANTNNEEYHEIRNNDFQGEGSAIALGNIGVVGSTLTSPSAIFTSADEGRRIRIADAGSAQATPPAVDNPVVLDTFVDQVVNATTVTLVTGALRTINNGYAVLGEGLGRGIAIGPNANAKAIRIEANTLVGCEQAIHVEGGSYHARANSFTDNDVNIHVTSVSEPCTDVASNSEYSRRHLYTASPFQFNIQSGRFDVHQLEPNGAYIETATSAGLVLVASETEGQFPHPRSVLLAIAQADRALLVGNWFSPAVAIAQLGASPISGVSFINNVGISDLPPVFIGSASQLLRRDSSPVSSVISRVTSGSSSSHWVALRADANTVTDGPYDAWLVGVQASGAGEVGALNNANFRCFEAQFPISGSGERAKELEGVRVVAAGLTNGSSANRATGVLIEPMKVTGVTAGRGIVQQGVEDMNILAGRTIQAGPASAPTDTDIAASQISFYVDEASDVLKVRVRYSDGTTLKTGSVTLL